MALHISGESPAPAGSPYDWYQRARALVESGSPEAALLLLGRLEADEPGTRSVAELRGRALFDTRRYADAARAFELLTELAPDDDYAHFGLGMALWRLHDFPRARDHLALACAMRPARREYAQALRQVRATLASREAAGLPLQGSIDPSITGGGIGVADADHHQREAGNSTELT